MKQMPQIVQDMNEIQAPSTRLEMPDCGKHNKMISHLIDGMRKSMSKPILNRLEKLPEPKKKILYF